MQKQKRNYLLLIVAVIFSCALPALAQLWVPPDKDGWGGWLYFDGDGHFEYSLKWTKDTYGDGSRRVVYRVKHSYEKTISFSFVIDSIVNNTERQVVGFETLEPGQVSNANGAWIICSEVKGFTAKDIRVISTENSKTERPQNSLKTWPGKGERNINNDATPTTPLKEDHRHTNSLNTIEGWPGTNRKHINNETPTFTKTEYPQSNTLNTEITWPGPKKTSPYKTRKGIPYSFNLSPDEAIRAHEAEDLQRIAIEQQNIKSSADDDRKQIKSQFNSLQHDIADGLKESNQKEPKQIEAPSEKDIESEFLRRLKNKAINSPK